MSIQQQTTECTLCGIEMDLVDEGSERSVPIIGSDVEYRRYRCAECGQAVRYERTNPDDDWQQTGL